MPNPNEIERLEQEKQASLDEYQNSRNNISRHLLAQELRTIRSKIRNNLLSKSDKSKLLSKQRELEDRLGYDLEPYNGHD